MKKFEPVNPTPTTDRKENAANAKPKHILEALEYIAELAEDSNLDEDFMQNAAAHIAYATRKLKLSDMQVILLAIVIDQNDSCLTLSDIAEFTGCRTSRFLRLADDIDLLEKLRYIRISRGRHENPSYRVPSDVIAALRKNKAYKYEIKTVTDTPAFFDQLNRLMREKADHELTYNNLEYEVFGMLNKIKHTHFAQAVNSKLFFSEDKMVFIFMAHLFVENADDNIGFRDMEELYDEAIPRHIKNDLSTHHSDLFRLNFIEAVNSDGMICPNRFKLTQKAKDDVLAELELNRIGSSGRDLLKHDTFAEKQLIYNSAEQKQVSDLAAILSAERFSEVQSQLRRAGMRAGFCCLFYGAPGTGKTETVYQVARTTGRDILQVDVDKIKSSWVGESEKNIKKLFDRYRGICQNAPLAPILLFNEADAVLGVRMEGAARAVDKMENSLQNIILQEMEALDGIMIATTNLTANLDKAFERRFLYKIQFNRPTVEARAQIWQAMLPGLKPEDARTLSADFDLSGGEIENIVRKHTVNAILSGHDEVDFPLLMENCRLERIDSHNGRRRIGF